MSPPPCKATVTARNLCIPPKTGRGRFIHQLGEKPPSGGLKSLIRCWQHEEISHTFATLFWNNDIKKSHTQWTSTQRKSQVLHPKLGWCIRWSNNFAEDLCIAYCCYPADPCGMIPLLAYNTWSFFAVWCFTLAISVLFFLRSCSRGVASRNVAAWKMHDFYRLLATLSFLDIKLDSPP